MCIFGNVFFVYTVTETSFSKNVICFYNGKTEFSGDFVDVIWCSKIYLITIIIEIDGVYTFVETIIHFFKIT